MSTNQIALRQAFKAIKQTYAAVGREPIITPSDLRMEAVIVQNANFYQFFPLQQDANLGFAAGMSNTEIKLNQNDAFWAVLAGLYICNPSSATSAEYKLAAYPSPSTFTAARAAAYDIFFNNSTLDISINNVQYIQNFLSSRFRNTPFAQAGLGATSSTAAPANVPSTTIDSFDGNESGITSLGTLIEISGQRKAQIKLNVPTGLATAPAGTERLVLVLRGFIALNAATR